MLSLTPKWFQWAVREIGNRELPDNRGPAVRRYIGMAKVGREGDPWCAIFANAAFETNGFKGTRSASSQSFRYSKDFVRIQKPFYGALIVYWRGTNPNSGIGHVGFYNGEEGDYISTIGGNESDMVREEMFPKQSSHFGLVGYFMPANYVRTMNDKLGPLPVLVPHGTKFASSGILKVT